MFHIYKNDAPKLEYVPTFIILLKMAKIFPKDKNINIIVNKIIYDLRQINIDFLSYYIKIIDNDGNYKKELYDSFAIKLFENIDGFNYDIIYNYLLKLFRCVDIDYIKTELEMTHNKLLNKYANPFYDNLRFIFFMASLQQYFYYTKHDMKVFTTPDLIKDQNNIFFDIYMGCIFIDNIKNDYTFIDIIGISPIDQFYKNIILLNKSNIESVHNYYSTKLMDSYYKNNLYKLDIIFDNNILKKHDDDLILESKQVINSYVYHKIFSYVNGLIKKVK
jgi:hypothetical protein